MIHARVKAFDHFALITTEVNQLCRAAVQDGAEEAARVASSIAGQRRRSGDMADMTVIDAHGTVDGWAAGVKSGAWYAWFQDRGTLGSRSPRAKRPGNKRSHAAGTGIEPLHFFEAARSAGRKKMLARFFRGH